MFQVNPSHEKASFIFRRKIKLYFLPTLFGALRVNVSVLSNSYRSTMVCSPVRGDNPRALSRIDGLTILFIISVDLAENEIFCADTCELGMMV